MTTHDDWDGLVVLCAATNWSGIRMADRHLAECLAEHTPVLYVDPPLSHLTHRNDPTLATALDGPRLKIVRPGLARLTPVVPPFGLRRGLTMVSQRIVSRELRRAVARLGGDVAAVVSSWILVDPYPVAGRGRRIYWWQDDAATGAELWGVDRDRLLAAEQRRVADSDLIVCVNEEATRRWVAAGHDAQFVPHGCDVAHFAQTDEAPYADDVDLCGPIAAFVGHLNARTDLSLLEAVADRDMSLLMVGPRDRTFERERVDRLLGRANVAWVGPKPFECLPSYLRHVDVGLVPYADNGFNRNSFPMKTLEYLSAGRAVVSTPLPGTLWLDTDLVLYANEPSRFADATERALETARDPLARSARRAFAARHAWSDRADSIAALVERRNAS